MLYPDELRARGGEDLARGRGSVQPNPSSDGKKIARGGGVLRGVSET